MNADLQIDPNVEKVSVSKPIFSIRIPRTDIRIDVVRVVVEDTDVEEALRKLREMENRP